MAPKGNKHAVGNSGGRPKSYRDEYGEQVFKLCLLGATDKELADFFDVCEKTINGWKKDYPEFLQSLKRGKLLADANVTRSLSENRESKLTCWRKLWLSFFVLVTERVFFFCQLTVITYHIR